MSHFRECIKGDELIRHDSHRAGRENAANISLFAVQVQWCLSMPSMSVTSEGWFSLVVGILTIIRHFRS